MFEVTFIKEIKNVEEKFIANLTKRQLVCILAGTFLCVPVYMYMKPVIGKEICDWLILIVGLLSGLMGWYKKNGLYFEEYVKIMMHYRFLINQKRICRFETEMEKEIEKLYRMKSDRLETIRRKRVER